MTLYWICKTIALFLFKIFFRLELYGREYIPKKGAFILASNHVSFLDPIAVGCACPRSLIYIARDSLFRNRAFAALLAGLHVIPLRRHSADIWAMKKAIRALKQGMPVVLFPEGTRSASGKLSEPLAGVGFLAARANVSVIPAFVRGSEKALPRGAKYPHPERISVYYGPRVPIDTTKTYRDIACDVMAGIRGLEQNS